MIPKVIHYCWFGGKDLPQSAIKCIESWKKYCPDYEIKRWDESNFDVCSHPYTKEAYETKKWAFITDYVRLYALVTEGGIYMDTDVEVIKPLTPFLQHEAFSGFESESEIPTGIMACKKEFELFKMFLAEYDDRHFLINNEMDLTTNVITITNKCMELGLQKNNKFQIINGFVLYPKDFFCPKNYKTGDIDVTENTVAIHHFDGTWLPKRTKMWNDFERACRIKGGKTITKWLDSRWCEILHRIFERDFRANIRKAKEKLKKAFKLWI
ncbi:MAG: glycosyl transferase [Lachnospiraceae bacterium]|nr:glycosyl transferase [Lachnospiraceae bacterium]